MYAIRSYYGFLAKLGYPWIDESRNPAYRMFLV